MASSGKKGKKSKGKTLALTDFLLETPGTVPAAPIRKSNINWADEVDDDYNDRSRLNNVVLPTAPKAARGIEDYGDKVSQDGPFIAYLSNLPYDIDEEEVREIFCDQKIASMKMPKESDTNRLRGFGYVEFEDRDSLLEVLAIPEALIKGRRIRIELASSMDPDRRRGGRMDNRDRPERPEVTMGDWRSGPRDAPTGGGGGGYEDRRREGGGGFTRGDREGGGGFTRGDREGGGGGGFSRERMGEGRGGERERETDDKPGAWREGMEKAQPPSSDRFSRDGDKSRGGFSRDRDFDRNRERDSRDGDRYGDRGSDRGFGPSRSGRGRDERNGGMTRGPPREEGSSAASSQEARTRPKLVLAPRTLPVEDPPPPPPDSSSATSAPEAETESVEEAEEGAALPPPPEAVAAAPPPPPAAAAPPPPRPPVTAASIFGSAKPVDTSVRERQIEERLAKTTLKEEGGGERGDREMRRSDRDRDDGRRDIRRGEREEDSRRDNGRSPRRASPEGRDNRRSPDRRRYSPPRRRHSPELRRASPDHRRTTDDRDKRGPPQSRGAEAKPPAPKREERHRAPREEHEMPKVKEPEPVNYADSNKFAFLQTEGDSDNDE